MELELISEYFIFHINRIKAPHEQICLSYTSLQQQGMQKIRPQIYQGMGIIW